MLDSILRSMLGGYGEAILDFYLDHTLIINGIILLYALIVSFSYKSYRLASTLLISYLHKNHAKSLEKKTAAEMVYKLEKIDLPWEDSAKVYWFPFIAQPRKLLPRWKKLETMKELISLSSLADKLKKLYDMEKNNG